MAILMGVSRRLRMIMAVAALVAGIVAFLPGTAGADSVYHTERLVFAPAEDSGESGSGMVVNIHPNGPVNGALERYQLKEATPNTDYDVWIVVAGDDFAQTATISTDRHGNGHAKAGFSADELAGFSGAVLPVQWVLRSEAGDAYRTEITTVTLD
jgi:hypothetical protein